MSYNISDADKKDLGTLTVSAWSGIYKASKKANTKCPAILQLATHGYTNLLVALKLECKNLSAANPSLKESFSTLLLAANKAHELVILGQ